MALVAVEAAGGSLVPAPGLRIDSRDHPVRGDPPGDPEHPIGVTHRAAGVARPRVLARSLPPPAPASAELVTSALKIFSLAAARARARGRVSGRPATVSAERVQAAREMHTAGRSWDKVADLLGVSRSALFRAPRREPTRTAAASPREAPRRWSAPRRGADKWSYSSASHRSGDPVGPHGFALRRFCDRRRRRARLRLQSRRRGPAALFEQPRVGKVRHPLCPRRPAKMVPSPGAANNRPSAACLPYKTGISSS